MLPTEITTFKETEEGFILIPHLAKTSEAATPTPTSEFNGRKYEELSLSTFEMVEEDPFDAMRYNKKPSVPILCLDGGGTRIVYPLELLGFLEDELAKETDQKDLKLAHVFKVFGGTSAGAIVALGLNATDSAGHLRHTVKDINELIPKFAASIFPYSYWQSVKSWTANKPLYDRGPLQKFCKDFFHDQFAKDSYKDFLVPVYQLNSGISTKLFTRKLCRSDQYSSLSMNALVEMTVSAPTYFKPMEWKNCGYVDGGVTANNPSMQTYFYAKQEYPNSNYITCSFGTGITLTCFDEGKYDDNAYGWGTLTWAPDILELFFNAREEEIEELMLNLYGEHPEDYFRFQSKIPYIPLDTTNEKVFEKLREYAKKEKEEKQGRWRKMVKTLAKIQEMENDGFFVT